MILSHCVRISGSEQGDSDEPISTRRGRRVAAIRRGRRKDDPLSLCADIGF